MKNFKIIFYILIILLKTGNILCEESIFTVNNIQINKNAYKNKEELINIAFRKGFEKLNNKILLERDYKKTENISLRNIKNLVSHYRIIKNKDRNVQNFETVNLYFKRDKMYEFYSRNNIKYSDVSGKILTILPVLLLNDEIFIYDNNFFYNNWIENTKKKKMRILSTFFPLENLETIATIKANQKDLEMINLNDIFDKDMEKGQSSYNYKLRRKKQNFFKRGNIFKTNCKKLNVCK